MTSNSCALTINRSTLRGGAGALALSIAAALVVGVLRPTQGAPTGAQASAPRSDVTADPAAAPPLTTALDAGVDWGRVERAPDPMGASVAAYEQ